MLVVSSSLVATVVATFVVAPLFNHIRNTMFATSGAPLKAIVAGKGALAASVVVWANLLLVVR